MVEPVGSSPIYLVDRVAILYLSRRRNKNSELSYEAELSCLSKSSISLRREKKNLQYLVANKPPLWNKDSYRWSEHIN